MECNQGMGNEQMYFKGGGGEYVCCSANTNQFVQAKATRRGEWWLRQGFNLTAACKRSGAFKVRQRN